MRPEVRALKDAASQAAHAAEIRMSEFLDRGLEQVLEEAEQNNWPAQEMAFQLLTKCCLTEGKFNNFQAGFRAVTLFLDEQFGKEGIQVYIDLAKILTESNNPENAIRRWLESYFPDSRPQRKIHGPYRR